MSKEELPPREFSTQQVGQLLLSVPSNLTKTHRNFEPLTRALIEANLAPGEMLLDIGANFGFYTLVASQIVGPTRRVIAVEPAPNTVGELLSNVESNHLANVRVILSKMGAVKARETSSLLKPSLTVAYRRHPSKIS